MQSLTAVHVLAALLGALSAGCFSYAAAPFTRNLIPAVGAVPQVRSAALGRNLKKRRLTAQIATSGRGQSSLAAQLHYVNAPVSAHGFAAISFLFMFAVFATLWASGSPLLLCICGGGLAGWQLPRAALSMALKLRARAFRDTFAPALDTIIRAAQAGMPLNRCLQIAAGDGAGNLNTQLARLSAEITSGAPLPAFQRFGDASAIPEARFFAFTLALQQQTGGNLSKALGSLSGMLRGRATFRAKVATLTAEARMSAIIICSLPVIVAAALAIASPDYLTPLWMHPVGRICLAGAFLSVLTGAAIMRLLIKSSFDT